MGVRVASGVALPSPSHRPGDRLVQRVGGVQVAAFSLLFDGLDDYMKLPNIPGIRAVSVWMKKSSVQVPPSSLSSV